MGYYSNRTVSMTILLESESFQKATSMHWKKDAFWDMFMHKNLVPTLVMPRSKIELFYKPTVLSNMTNQHL